MLQCPVLGSFAIPIDWTDFYGAPEALQGQSPSQTVFFSIDTIVGLCEMVEKNLKK
jgi:hypothetical protein